MTTFDRRLLTPQEPEEVRLPYRPVWRTTAYETAVMVVGTLVINLLASLFGVRLEAAQRVQASALLALAPPGLWLLFSWQGERRAPQPREGLLAIVAVSALAANGLAAPFVEEVVAPDAWLTGVPGLTRILGYTLTVGLVYEFVKYLVLRYMAWPRRFQTRIDGMAYSLAASLAFATALNLRFALLEGGAQPGAAAIRITSTVLAQQAIGLVMGHRLVTLKFGRPGVFSLAGGLLLAGFLTGFYIAFRAGLVVGSFGIGATANTPLLGFGFVVAFSLALFAAFAFLISSAEARDARLPGGGRR